MSAESYTPPGRQKGQYTGWQRSSLRTRLIIGIVLVTILTMAIAASLVAFQLDGVNNFVFARFRETARAQAIQQLSNIATNESENFAGFLSGITADMAITANYITGLLAQQGNLGEGLYWHAPREMKRLAEGQWGNSINDPGSVLAPSSFEMTKESAAVINSTIYLDLIIPDLLAKNPALLAVYYVSDQGVTHYYPNIDLANVVGDFDPRQRPYYQVYLSEDGRNLSSYWTLPYVDAALGGLVETNSVPVYDQDGVFRGVIGADITISTIVDRVTQLAEGESGYAFLIDADGRFLAISPGGYADLGFTPEDVPAGGIPERTALEVTTEISPLLMRMMDGQQGVETFTRDGVERFVAYAPIESVGYSLAIVAPAPELLATYFSAQEQAAAQERAGWTVTAVTLVIIVITAIGLSMVVGNLLTRPVTALTKAAEKVAEGQLDVQVSVPAGGEIGILADAFNSMTTQLRDMVGSLEEQVASRTWALQVSTEVGQRLATILDPGQLVTEVVNQVQSAFRYYHVHIYLYNEGEQKLVMAGGTGKAGATMLAAGHALGLHQGLVGLAATRREPVLVPDVRRELHWLPNPLLPETRSEAAVPILYGDALLGVLDVQQKIIGGLSEEDVYVLQSVASQVAIALRNARLYAQAQRQAEQQTTINEISRRIQNAANVEAVLQVAVRELAQALGSTRASIEINRNMVVAPGPPGNGRTGNPERN